ncbi:MAG: 50S ribosomal protein L23 [Kiritimatiellae bacterium]|nr:50S ribosomal protein L23 [Kiritimatiellia bacterium]MBQ9344382.1 50S ribosomal protein L23 [Kiritimatiellia bacterium]
MQNIIKKLLVTEKGTAMQAATNSYLFEVDKAANKLQIRQAVEQEFKVKVKDVRTMMRKGKAKRVGRNRTPGRTSDWKRAVVTLESGNTIETA